MSESPAAATPVEDQQEDVPVTENTEAADMAADLSDDGSELSDVNEDEFENFDVNAINIEEADIDQDTLKEVKAKRKERKPGEEPRKKKKEGRKEKQQAKKAKRRRGEDDEVSGEGVDADGPRGRRRKLDDDGGAERRKKREETPEDQLPEDERTRRQIEKRVNAIIKRPKARRRQGGDDLATFMDEEIVILRNEMSDAARLDGAARAANPPQPAMRKLKLLPKVVALLNKNGRESEQAIVDPENNILESVRFFLEPLNDGSLPAYNIQRELFEALLRLPINKETLIASGIGRVILFYTKSKKAEPPIRRIAEKLLAEWTRPILRRSDDYRKRALQEVEYDPERDTDAGTQQLDLEEKRRRIAIARARAAREKAMELPNPGNRARLEKPEQRTYTIVPKSNLTHLQRKR